MKRLSRYCWLLTNADHYGRPNRWLQKTSVVPSEQGFTGKNTNYDVWRRKRRCEWLLARSMPDCVESRRRLALTRIDPSVRQEQHFLQWPRGLSPRGRF
jgi:hypothetical protein